MSLFKGAKTTTRADKIEAFQSTTCDFGTPLPIAYGTCKLSPNLVNYQNLTCVEVKTTQKSGKSKTTTINYQYSVYAELALCEGVIDGIGKIWVGDDVYLDLVKLNAKSSNIGSPLSVNAGNNNAPTTYMATKHPDIATGYNGMAFLYGFVYLGENQAAIPSYSVEVKGLCRNGGIDANPADVIKDLLGRLGYEDCYDEESFEHYRSYCAATDLLISTPADAFGSQSKCQDYVKTLLDLTNAYMFWAGDRFKIVPRDDRSHGTWKPKNTVLYDITEDDMQAGSDGVCVSFSRKDSSEIYNRYGVTFTNRENDYDAETVFYEDTEDIAVHGLRNASTIDGRWFHTLDRALKVAEMQTRIAQTENVRYIFKVDWKYVTLEPGDVITITDKSINLDHQKCMIESVTEDANGLISVTALRREPGEAAAPTYSIPKIDYNRVNFNTDPGDVDNPLVIIPPSELVTASSGVELWVALHGITSHWGGCDVYLSTKHGSYSKHGTQSTSADYGRILTAMTNTATDVDVLFTNAKPVEMQTVEAGDDPPLVYVDGEFMTYGSAELIGANQWRLSGLTRGVYNSRSIAHDVGSNFAVIDSNLYTIQLTRDYLEKSKVLYMKFPSFNTLKKNNQELKNIEYYTHNVAVQDIPNVSNVAVTYSRGGTVQEPKYTVSVSWKRPDYNAYASARVYFKAMGEGWQYKAEGFDNATVSDISPGIYTIAVCTKDNRGIFEAPNDSAQETIILS